MPRTRESFTKTRHDMESELIASIRSMADKAFAQHVVEPRMIGVPVLTSSEPIEAISWVCGQPGNSIYRFHLYSVPGRLIVCGDLGFCAWERCYNMIGWARGAINSLEYFAEKVPNSITVKEYSSDMVRGWVAEIDRSILDGDHDLDSKITKAWLGELRTEIINVIDGGKDRVYAVLDGTCFCDDMPSFETYKPAFLWQREAVRWFLNNWCNHADRKDVPHSG